MDVPRTRRSLEGLAKTAREFARPAGLGELSISVTPAAAPEAGLTENFRGLGVDRLIWLMPQNEADIMRMIERLAVLNGV